MTDQATMAATDRREYCQEHKAEVAAYMREYYRKNRNKYIAYQRKYRKMRKELEAAEDSEIANVLIEREGDGLRFRNHERDPKTKRIVRCECYLK